MGTWTIFKIKLKNSSVARDSLYIIDNLYSQFRLSQNSTCLGPSGK
jgi:hypothetical protein